MHTLGKHFLLDLKDCNKDVLDDLEFLRTALSSVAQRSQEEMLGESFYHFTPQGVSGLVLATGSHICIHTWPEYGYAAVDIFTHSDSFHPEEAAKLIIEKLGSQNPSIVELKRGA
ncbi:adenosylmethionine decarboxylase [Dehalococcoidia bacterium]|nr:adenosylmethionine decarboxylase [Dehalococcoidia bacterium]MCL0098328.1 adenosylmethionine decarboxylase [Dehalococcoidia bacterium]MCL0103352.1 adenosylmethionine decarboxylase [Dehalococcoidia bacterium]